MIRPLLRTLAAISLAFTVAASEGPAVVQRIDLELQIDRGTRSVRGEETIVLLPMGNRRVTFPLFGQSVHSVRTVTGTLDFSAAEDELTIMLPKVSAVSGSVELTIEYSAAAPSGVVFGEHTIYSGFETCTWMICDPSPGVRASFRLTLEAAAGELVIASGGLERVERVADGSRRFVWSQREPYPAYLYGFALGPFRMFTTDVDGTIFTSASSVADLTSLRRYTEAARGMVRLFETVAGMPLPHGRYTQVVVEGAAAQEKSTFSLLGTSQLAALATDPSEDWLIAHELAHQFWGNLVTPKTWDEMWLSEGLVTFMTAAWKEQRFGRAAYDREMELARRRMQFAIDEGYAVPLRWSGEYPTLRIRRAIAYSRGALFFDHLRALLGERSFWRAIRRFTHSGRGRSVGSEDLQKAFERESGQDLSAVFAEWVYE